MALSTNAKPALDPAHGDVRSRELSGQHLLGLRLTEADPGGPRAVPRAASFLIREERGKVSGQENF
jgi:hypothetical protein